MLMMKNEKKRKGSARFAFVCWLVGFLQRRKEGRARRVGQRRKRGRKACVGGMCEEGSELLSGSRGGGSGGLLPAVFDDLTHLALVLSLVVHEETGSLSVGGRVGVGVTEERLDGCEDGCDVIDGCPHVLEDIKTDTSIGIHCVYSNEKKEGQQKDHHQEEEKKKSI